MFKSSLETNHEKSNVKVFFKLIKEKIAVCGKIPVLD